MILYEIIKFKTRNIFQQQQAKFNSQAHTVHQK